MLPLYVNKYPVDHELEQVPKTTREKEGCIGDGVVWVSPEESAQVHGKHQWSME